MQALYTQLEKNLQKYSPQIETVFIGGGTPSTIDPLKYKYIIQTIKPYLVCDDIEITIEANPNSATPQWLETIYQSGINRISFGVQSFNDQKLNFLARNHNKNQAINAINKAHAIGFEHINCDIIYDTSLDTKQLLQEDMNIISNLPIDHVSAYSLTIEEGTKFFDKSHVKKENQHLTEFLFDTLHNMGFEQYEISNFAKDHEARSTHNMGYWEYKEYLGIGSGAVGRISNQRYTMQKDVMQYIQNPFDTTIEDLSDEEMFTEKILLGLRSCVGIDTEIFSSNQLQKVQELIANKNLIKTDGKIYSTNYLLADEIALYLL